MVESVEDDETIQAVAELHRRAATPGAGLVVVIGNEKGGTSKSTTAMHLFTALADAGLRVGVVDLDTRQRSLLRYLENRENFAARRGVSLELPKRVPLTPARRLDVRLSEQMDQSNFTRALGDLLIDCDLALIDCPGANTFLAQVAHMCADVLLTPVGASLVDCDLLANFDADQQAYHGPSIYAETVWQARHIRRTERLGPLRWFVALNRFHPRAKPERLRVAEHLRVLGERLDFRPLTGIAERAVYRDLFEHGLTVFDLEADHHARAAELETARAEIWRLIDALEIPALAARRGAA